MKIPEGWRFGWPNPEQLAGDIPVAVGMILAASKPCIVTICGVRLRVHFRRGRGNGLLALYNAAIPREEAKLPRFQPFLDLPVPQISIFDETLHQHSGLTSGWYLGLPSWHLPAVVASLVKAMGDRLGVGRRIHVGGSSGGFAALLLSWLDAGSVAIAVSPQTDLTTYRGASAMKLLDLWPMAADLDALGKLAPVDLRELYAGGCGSSAIVVVSDGDVGHLYGQVLPFLSSIRANERRQVVLHVSYWGVPGHGRSVPSSAYRPWVRAALMSSSIGADDIRACWRALEGTDRQEASGQRDADYSRDLQLADLVGRHMSREDKWN